MLHSPKEQVEAPRCLYRPFPSPLVKASFYLVTRLDQDARHTSIGEGLAGKQKGRECSKEVCKCPHPDPGARLIADCHRRCKYKREGLCGFPRRPFVGDSLNRGNRRRGDCHLRLMERKRRNKAHLQEEVSRVASEKYIRPSIHPYATFDTNSATTVALTLL